MKVLRRIAVAAIFAVMQPACTGFIAHERGLAKRIEATKQAGAAVTALVIARSGADRIEIALLARRVIALQRRIVYNAIELRGEWNPNPLWELFEVPFGLLALPMAPFMYGYGYGKYEDTEVFRADSVRNSLAFWLGFINPFQSVVAARVVRNPNVDQELFFSPPVKTSYAVSLPVPDEQVRFRVTAATGELIREGVARTDDFGRIVVDKLPHGALLVQAWHQGQEVAVALRPRPAGDR